MISFIKGNIYDKTMSSALIEVCGVGYEVFLTTKDLLTLKVGNDTFLHTYFNVKEDSQMLFGFLNPREKDFFLKLIGLNGIGPKLAQGILNDRTFEDVVLSIKGGDLDYLVRISGIGKKTGQRMILELSDKLEDFSDIKGISNDETLGIKGDLTIFDEAIEALMFLGYTKKDVEDTVKIILSRNEGIEIDQLIKRALKELGR